MKIEKKDIIEILGEIKETKKTVNKEFEEIKQIYETVNTSLNSTELEEISNLDCIPRRGGIYLDNGNFREWKTEKMVTGIGMYERKNIIDEEEDNLKNLYEFLTRIRDFYKE